MLTIDVEGAQALLRLLQRAREGHPVGEAELEETLDANAFFTDFYSRWEGSSRQIIREVIRQFDRPEEVPAGILPTRLAEGLRQAADEMDLLQGRLSWLREIDAANIVERVLAFLPTNTPLDSVIHITVDLFNNAFAYQGEMGVSLLKGMADRETFEDAVSHELHHVGLHFWSEQDTVRQTLLQERSGRAVAVLHVENLLSEGMANYYCTPKCVFRESSPESVANAYQARLARLQRDEGRLFARAAAILDMCLEHEAEHESCWNAFKSLALDMEEAMLPAGHYLGARMVQTMEQAHPRKMVVDCVRHLPRFLPLYNEAARKAGAFVFDPRLIDTFGQLFECEV
jgi:hypothetical protein